MLVLSRKSQECVVIGGADGLERIIRITVLDIRDGRVRLGFDADADIPVHRSEVWERLLPNGRGPPPAEKPPAPAG